MSSARIGQSLNRLHLQAFLRTKMAQWLIGAGGVTRGTFVVWEEFVLKTMVDLKIISKKEFERMKEEGSVVIEFGFGESPFGRWLVGMLHERICHISFVKGDGSDNVEELQSQWGGSRFVEREGLGGEVRRKVFEEGGVLGVLLKGSTFEGKVWKAVLRIGKGRTVSYEEVARMSGHPSAVRATANAVGKNSVAYVVPCHRVIRKDGSVHKYKWGSHIKRAILEFEKRSD